MAVNELFALPLTLVKVLLALLLELVKGSTDSSPLSKGRYWPAHRHNYAKNDQQQNA